MARALICDARRCGTAIEVVSCDARSWASVTFTGARHVIAIVLQDTPESLRWIASLAEADLPIPGHLLADLVVISHDACDGQLSAQIEALTVEER